MDERPQGVRIRGPRSERCGHRLEIGTRRVAVLDRAVAHGRGQEALRVGLAPLSCVGARGVTPDGGRDPEIRDTDAVEKRAELAPHLRLATVLDPRSLVHLYEAVDPGITRPVRHRAPVNISHRDET